MSYNKIILLGRLGKNAEVKYTQTGTPVANFSMATDHYAGRDKPRATQWHSIVLWGKAAEALGQYLVKGTQVLVEGRVETRQWQDKDGATRYKTEVIASEVRLAGSKSQGQPQDQQGGNDDVQYTEDDIPF